MANQAETHPISQKVRRSALWMVLAAAFAVLVAWMVVSGHADTGDQIIRDGEVEDEREAVKLLMDSYTSVIGLVTAAFGAAAFLLTLQQGRKTRVSLRAARIFLTGIAFLAGALIPALVGREALLTMLVHNAVDIHLPMLTISRWISYGCIVIAAILVASFALEVAVAPVEAPQVGGASGPGSQGRENADVSAPRRGTNKEHI
jgi:hypothetical protein